MAVIERDYTVPLGLSRTRSLCPGPALQCEPGHYSNSAVRYVCLSAVRPLHLEREGAGTPPERYKS